MNIQTSLLWFYWNPPREMVHIPIIDRPILWYGFLFVLGFVIGYWIVIPMLMMVLTDSGKQQGAALREECKLIADRLSLYVIFGAIVGARLGHVFFYGWPLYKNHPMDIFKIWEGGLASHGGVIGILLALYLFRRTVKAKYPSLTFLKLVDILTVPSMLGGAFIRMGNFVNQEILGLQTTLPWGVVFGNAADGSAPVPRHPVQLYEAIGNIGILFLLLYLWNKDFIRKKDGMLAGIFFVVHFSLRIFFESFKEPQSFMIDESWISTGQMLSFPFILLGILLIFVPRTVKSKCAE